jgi:replication factor C large subunit
MTWTKKYAPKKISEIINQPTDKIKKILATFSTQKKKAILLWGPSGSGKTSCVHAIANEKDYELLELNASDYRDKNSIEQLVGNSLAQRSLFSKGKIILVDDVEGLTREDRGGATALAKLLSNPTFPILLTSQDPFSKNLSSLRTKCQLIEFSKIPDKIIEEELKKILANEKIEFTEKDISIISKFAQGDLRAAINDAEMLSIGGNKLDVGLLLALEERIKNKSAEDAVREVLKGKGRETLNAFNSTDLDLDQAMLWLDYNMGKEYYNPADRARAYGCLSKADVFLRRIKRRQHWHFLVYVNALLTAGVASAKDAPYPGEGKYEQTTRILKIWRANITYGLRKSIAEKIAERTHCSKKEVIKNFEMYKMSFKQNSKNIEKELKLDEEELAFMSS